MENLYSNTTFVLSTLAVVLIIAYIRKIQKSYKFFEERGIRNPPVKFLVGNFHETYQNVPRQLLKWGKEYGKTYGYFEGHLPILVTSDLDIINEVFVKQSSNFAARRRKAIDAPDSSPRVGLITATEARWKNMRTIMGPAFSPLKLKEMFPLYDMTTSRFIQRLDNVSGKEIDVKNYVKNLTMDTIWYCAFGVDIDSQKDSIYMEKVDSAVKAFLDYNLAGYLTTFFHEFHNVIVTCYLACQIVLYKLKNYSLASRYLSSLFWIRESSISIVNKRIEENSEKHDFLSLLLAAYTEDVNETQNLEKLDYETTRLKKTLSVDEIKMNLAMFLFAGYDTQYVTMSFCFHYLAKYPLEQEKVAAEIEQHFPHDSNVEVDMENVKQLESLRMFIDEVSRLNLIAANVVTRRCVNATTVKGIPIPKDITVQVDVESLHRDPELWGPVDPEEFHPERFSKEYKRPTLAFMAFGGGPRQCIGMRFAYNVMTLTLAKVLRKYEVQKGENFIEELQFNDGFVRNLIDPVNIKLVNRVF